jgi:hypothetical protein
MDKISILKNIKVLLGLEDPQPASPTYTLKDGTPVTISALELGGTVMVGDAKAPVGEHELSDGTVITVDENGVITNIKPSQVEAQEQVQEPQQPAGLTEEMVRKIVAEMLKEKTDSIEARLSVQKEANAKIIALISDILNTPAASTQAPQQPFAAAQPLSKTERFANLKKALEKIKN